MLVICLLNVSEWSISMPRGQLSFTVDDSVFKSQLCDIPERGSRLWQTRQENVLLQLNSVDFCYKGSVSAEVCRQMTWRVVAGFICHVQPARADTQTVYRYRSRPVRRTGDSRTIMNSLILNVREAVIHSISYSLLLCTPLSFTVFTTTWLIR